MESGILSRPRWLTLGVAVVGLLLALACGGDKESPAPGGALAPPDQQQLRLRIAGEPKTIDPHLANFVGETSLMKPLFAGLFTYDADLRVVPNLAEELPAIDNGGVSRDGLTYTVKIDKDAKWSDGKAVTAQDFVYSMKRALDPKLASTYVSFFYEVVGAREYNTALGTEDEPKTPSDADLAALRDKVGVSAKDERTVVYQLRQADPSFLSKLALWTAFPVRQDVVEKHGAKWTEAGNLVGNGPFVLKEWTHNQRVVMEPNANWQGEKPKLTRIVVNFIADDAAAYAAYLAGELDAVVVPPPVLAEVTAPGSSLNAQLVRVPELVTYAVFMNNAVAPFDNVKVRQAFAMAIDRKAMVDGLLQGAGRPAASWIPPGMPGYNAALGYEFNPTKAKQLLAEAGFPEGKGLPKISFLAVAAPPVQLRMQFVEDQIKRNLGIEVTTEYVDPPVFGQNFTTKKYQAAIANWSADWAYPDNWLPELFASWGGNNLVAYKSPQFDDLMKKAAAETDERKRLALYDQAQKLMLDDAAISPLYNRESYLLVKPRVRDLVATALDGEIKGDYSFAKTYIAAE